MNMNRTPRLLGSVLLLAVASATPAIAAEPPAAAAKAAAAPAAAKLTLDQVLDMLDQRGQSLEAFTADVAMKESDETLVESTNIGKVWFQKLPDGNARFRVSFVERRNDKTKWNEPKDYVLNDGWLTERDHKSKTQSRRQVMRPGQKTNLLKLGEGPFPIPIGQKKEDVKKQFKATLVEDAKLLAELKLPPDTAHVLLEPAKGSDMRRQFQSIDVFVDPKTQMPLQIDTLDGKGQQSRSTKLSNVKVNPQPALTMDDFTLPKIANRSGWNETPDEPLK